MLQLHDDRYDDEPVPALSSLIRIGEVTAVDHAKLTARGTFDDADGLTSYELPILQRNTLRNRDYCTMDVCEDAVCIFLPTGVSRGFILGSVYAGEVMPPQSSGDVREIEFEDGTVVSYDRSSHRLVADVKGSVEGRDFGDDYRTGHQAERLHKHSFGIRRLRHDEGNGHHGDNGEPDRPVGCHGLGRFAEGPCASVRERQYGRACMSAEKDFTDILKEIIPYIGVASVCGLYASARRGWRGFRHLAMCRAGSSICGALTGWWMMSMGSSPHAIGAVCGVAGLLGDKGLQMLMEALAKKIKGED